MTKLRSKLVAGAVACALGIGASGQASADVLALSKLIVSDFIIYDASWGSLNTATQRKTGDIGTTQLDVNNFDKAEVNDTSTNQAFYIGGPGAAPKTASRDLNPPTDLVLGVSDALVNCLTPAGADCGPAGTAAVAENDFNQSSAFPPASNLVRSDSRLSGSIITGTDQPSSALSQQISEVQLVPNTLQGQTQSTNSNSTLFSFILDQDRSIVFEFDADALLRGILEEDDIISFASHAFNITITDQTTGAVVFAWTPDGSGTNSGALVNGGVEYSDPFDLSNSDSVQDAGSYLIAGDSTVSTAFGSFFRAATPILAAATEYQLTIQGDTFTRGYSRLVPEPATVALMGLGLVGLGFAKKRRGFVAKG